MALRGLYTVREMLYAMRMTKPISTLMAEELTRQQGTLSLIASENLSPPDIREAVGSVLMNKYSEGYPGKRYYGGNEIIDEIEVRAIEAAKRVFHADHANVQPYSGSPANMEVYVALLELGDTVMGMSLAHGGHLTHGHKVSFSGMGYKFVQYGVNPETGLLDYDEIEKMANIFKPKMIVCGATAYSRVIDFERFGAIARNVGALLLADISHIAGLVAGGAHPHPFPHADVVMTTTHKTLRGPRGAIIMCKAEHATAIDKAVFPGLQGGPHDNITAAKAIALEATETQEFRDYAAQIVKNSQALSDLLVEHGFEIVTGGTDNHLMLVDLTNKKITGTEADKALEQVGIIINKNMVPNDPRTPFDPSGIRLGTALLTSRGLKESDIREVGELIIRTLAAKGDEAELSAVSQQVKEICAKFPIL